MPIVSINWAAGRTPEQKDKIAEAITKAIVEIGKAKPEAVVVLFNDLPKESIAVGGKLLAK